MEKVKILISLLILLPVIVSCSKVDNIRDPISIKAVDLEYVQQVYKILKLIL